MLNQRLEQKLLQKLSPQQILLMKLLQVPAIALEQRIKEELEINPALEDLPDNSEESAESTENDDFSNDYEDTDIENSRDTSDFDMNDYLDEDDVADYKLQSNNYSPDDETKEVPISSETSFHEFLISQLGLQGLDDKRYEIGLTLIGNLDDSGYLQRDISAMVDDFAFSQNIITDEEEIESVLKVIQELDPSGVGARSLQECLLIQLRRIEDKTETIELAIQIIEHHFDKFTRKHYDKITDKLQITDEELRDAIEEIVSLNPKPGNSVSEVSRTNHYIVPDFNIYNLNGDLELQLNARNVPDLRISRTYTEMLQTYSESKVKTSQQKDAVQFIRQKIDSARWFIDAIRQRQNTLQTTMQAILDYQREFFEEGDFSKLRPMKLKDIAERVNLDISTVSRVANSKYVQTPFGTFLLKEFFSKSMSTEQGEDVSTTEIKTIIQNLIDNEDKTNALNDDSITEILNQKGYHIARRTVAKYRESLGIPVARLRKEI